MRRVFKWPLDLRATGQQIGGGPVVLVGEQDGELTVWTEEGMEPPYDRVVAVFGTGHTIPEDAKHLGSALMPPFVWHVYETLRF